MKINWKTILVIAGVMVLAFALFIGYFILFY